MSETDPQRTPRSKERKHGPRARIASIAAGVIALSGAGLLANSEERSEGARSNEEAKVLITNIDQGITQERLGKGEVSTPERVTSIKALLGDRFADYIVIRGESDSNYIEANSKKPTEGKAILLGEVKYTGKMKVEKLVSVGPDGQEFFEEVEDSPSSAEFLNPMIEFTQNGWVLSAGEGNSDAAVTRVTIGPSDLADAFVSDQHPEHPDSSLEINGHKLAVRDGGHTIDAGNISLFSETLGADGAAEFGTAISDLIVPVLGYEEHEFQGVHSINGGIVSASNITIGNIDGSNNARVTLIQPPQVGIS